VTLQSVANFVTRLALDTAIKPQLHYVLHEPATRSRVIVVHGLGGARMTQIILNYLEEFRSDYSGTLQVKNWFSQRPQWGFDGADSIEETKRSEGA
jgi:hypothetical protein